MESATLTNRRAWLTDSLLLAAVPAMAYVLAFAFEYGYYLAYGFPQELISVDLNRVFVAGAIFLAGVMLLLVVATIVLALLPSDYPLAPAVAQAVIFVLAYLVFLAVYGRLDAFGWILGLLVVWYLIYKFVLPLLTQRGVRGYVHKYSSQERTREAHTTLFRATLRTLGPTPGAILIYFFIAVVLAVTFGWYLATDRQCYFVVSEQPERVILRIYGDSFVLARLNRPALQILREYTVLRRTVSPIVLREECIGPLRVER